MAIQYIQAPFRVLDAVSPRLSARVALKFFTSPRRWPVPAWEQDIARTARPIRTRDDYRGMSWGQGPTVLLVHGWEGRATQLGRFVAPLVAAGFRVIGFDAPAHGARPGKALTVLQYADFLRDIIAEYAPLRGVIAHSMGASAIGFAARARLPVDRAVLISMANSVGGVVRRFEDLLGLSERTRAVLRQRLEQEIFHTPLATLDLSAQVPAFLPPALLLATDDDRDMPAADTALVAAHWPSTRIDIVHQAGGHRRVLRDDRVIESSVSFLADDAATSRPAEARSLKAAVAHAVS